MKLHSDRIETIFAGFLFVTIGTAIAASTVSAQNKSVAPPASSSKDPASCAPIETPDSMCTVPLKKGPETKICFGDKHPRCFELKGSHLVQSVNGGVIQDSTLTNEQQTSVKSAILSYTAWLEKELTKKPNKFNSCLNVASIDSLSEHKVFCLSRLPKKEADQKTKDLLATLELPTKSTRSSAL